MSTFQISVEGFLVDVILHGHSNSNNSLGMVVSGEYCLNPTAARHLLSLKVSNIP